MTSTWRRPTALNALSRCSLGRRGGSAKRATSMWTCDPGGTGAPYSGVGASGSERLLSGLEAPRRPCPLALEQRTPESQTRRREPKHGLCAAGGYIVCSMRSQNAIQWSSDPVTKGDPDVVVRGGCRCTLVRAWHTEDGWLLVPAVERGVRREAVVLTRQHDSILEARSVDDWESSSPLNVWCRHGVSTPDVAQSVRRWRPRLAA